MKKFLILLLMLFRGTAYAQTETLNWYIGDDVYATTTCESGGNVLLPTTPTKRGYTFKGWSGYTPIEYLESTGTQYIDTGVKQSDYFQNLIITAVFQYNNLYTQPEMLVGTASGNSFFSFWLYNGSFYVQSGAAGTETKIQADTNIHSIIFNSAQGIITIDKNNYNYSPNNAQAPYKIYLFARNNNGNSAAYANVKLYNISFSDYSGTLVRDFIPVLDSTGTPCLYDRVEGKFYYNQGTGQFIAGPIIGAE